MTDPYLTTIAIKLVDLRFCISEGMTREQFLTSPIRFERIQQELEALKRSPEYVENSKIEIGDRTQLNQLIAAEESETDKYDELRDIYRSLKRMVSLLAVTTGNGTKPLPCGRHEGDTYDAICKDVDKWVDVARDDLKTAHKLMQAQRAVYRGALKDLRVMQNRVTDLYH